jgi:DNA-binding beta-propeller fold protein YncE
MDGWRASMERERGAAVSTVIGVDESRRSGIQRGSVGYAQRASAAAVTRRRRSARRSAAILCVTLGVLLTCSAQALAAGQRQHLFSFTFGSLGTGAGQFFHPTGVGANAVSGDVYVSDRENGRVEGFQPVLSEGRLVGETPLQDEVEAGVFKAAQAKVPLAEQIAVDNCTSGSEPCTGDPSLGDVYVVGGTKAQSKKAEANPANDAELYKFNAELKPVGSPRTFKEPIDGVAVDPSGNVFVYQADGRIIELNDAEVNEGVGGASVQAGFDQELERPAFAVDSHGNFYAGTEANAEEAGGNPGVKALLQELDEEEVGVIAKLAAGTGDVLIHELDYEASRAVAVNTADVPANGVDEENDVYVAGVENVAGEPLTTVSAFSAAEGEGNEAEGEGKLIQRFGAPGLQEGEGIAVDPATGTVYVTDGASNQVDVFELEPAGKPIVSGLSQTLENGVRTLRAQVNPAGSETLTYFEYGTSSCTSSCGTTPASSAGDSLDVQGVSAALPNLSPGLYYYRVVAESPRGKVQSALQTFTVVATLGALPDARGWELVSPPEEDGAEAEPITKEGGLIEAAASGDAITYVTDGPTEADPEGSRSSERTQLLSTRDREPGNETWESQDIVTPNAAGNGVNPGAAPEYQLFSSTLALSIVDPFRFYTGRFENPPLSPTLSGESAGEQENTPYVRADAPIQPESSEATDYTAARENGAAMTPHANAGYLALVSKLNEPGPEFGLEASHEQGVRVQGGSADLSHLIISSERATAKPGLYEWTGNKTGVGTLQPVSILPGSETLAPAPEAGLGSIPAGGQGEERGDVRNAVSENGTYVFWSLKNHLYVRDTELSKTLQLSQEGEGEAVFQTASSNGSKVFFTDTQRLVSESSAETGAPNLYVAELEVSDGQISSKVTDLTPEPGTDILLPNGSGDGVIGASEQEQEYGSYVYFVANGALAPGARRGHCSDKGTTPRPDGTTCNLYVRHYDEATGEWEPTQLIAALSSEDQPNLDVSSPNPLFMTARVSPNGRYLAFMSNRRLTGYDNVNASEEAGQHADEEVYRYDAQEATLTCASCNPDGARPTGVFDTRVADGEGFTLIADRSEAWTEPDAEDHWLAGSVPGWEPLDTTRSPYQPRYLLNNGRVFFNSADALMPEGSTPGEKRTKQEHPNGGSELEAGIENVYEYEGNEVGTCNDEAGCIGLVSSGTSEHESAFLDASETGNDIFFLSAAQLTPQGEESFNVFDAHVCEAEAPCAKTPIAKGETCNSEDCLGSTEPAPPLSSPASVPFSGSGNVTQPAQGVLGTKTVSTTTNKKPLTRKQKLEKALKLCRKDKNKGKRLACEKQAKKKYGPPKPKAKKTNSSKGMA